ncbi:MAG: hypothetical protein KF832_05585 [Caldilineaceae bacterium]|nr:hypothetical protein [Caldilineaceae bacterium]
MISHLNTFHQVAVLFFLGIGCLYSAAFLASPFQHADAVTFYRAIHKNRVRYWRMNLLHTVAILVITSSFGLLAGQIWEANQPLTLLGISLLAAASLLWLIQCGLRLTATTTAANQVFTGIKPPATFPHNIGAGFDYLFLAFLGCFLVGMAAVLAGLGEAGMISPLMTRLGIVILIASGIFNIREYPWLGGVERVLFYPMASVILPLGLWFLLYGS